MIEYCVGANGGKNVKRKKGKKVEKDNARASKNRNRARLKTK